MNLSETIAWLLSARRNNPKGWRPVELGHWFDWVSSLEEPEFLIDHTILADACLMMSGPATIGFKSWTSFLLAEIIASGEEYEGLRATNSDGLPVLILEEEGPRKPTAARFEMIARGCKLDWQKARKNILMSHRLGVKLDDQHWSNSIARAVEEYGIKFVVIDTLAKTMQGDENSAQAIGKAMQLLDNLRVNGCTTMFLHHVKKQQGAAGGEHPDIDQDFRGSSALAGFYDQHIAIRRYNQEVPELDVTIRSNEHAETHFLASWEINKEAGTATYKIRRETKEVAVIEHSTIYARQLLREKQYSWPTLVNIWQQPEAVCEQIRDKLIAENVLRRVGTKYIKW